MARKPFSVIRYRREWAVCAHGEPVLSFRKRKDALALIALASQRFSATGVRMPVARSKKCRASAAAETSSSSP